MSLRAVREVNAAMRHTKVPQTGCPPARKANAAMRGTKVLR